MPKLKNRPPKYSRMKKYAVVYYHGKPHYLGLYGSPESKIAYARFVAELQANPAFSPAKGEKHVTVREVTAAFLDHAAANTDSTNYSFHRVIVLDFLDKLYGDNTPVEDFLEGASDGNEPDQSSDRDPHPPNAWLASHDF